MMDESEEVTSMPHAPYKTYDGTAAVPTDMETGGSGGGYSISGPKGTANVGGSGDKYSGSERALAGSGSVWALMGALVAVAL